MERMRFAGKKVMVTGGASGIGRATVYRLAREGAEVIIADVDEKAAQESIRAMGSVPGSAWFQQVDLSDPKSIEKMGEEVRARVDALHGLVHCAGILRTSSVEETGDADWEPQVTINLRAPALVTKELLPLLKRGPGHIVGLSSEGAFWLHRNRWVYDATKNGVRSLIRNLATELVSYGIRANSVAPGYVVTEMHFGRAEDPAKRKKELEAMEYDGCLMRRLASPDEIAAPIVFLLSDDASYITGTTIHVDGGRVGH